MERKIGIDFGTCNIKAAEKAKDDIRILKLGTKGLSENKIPNVILYEKKEDCKFYVGDSALKRPAFEQNRIRNIKSFLQEENWSRELSFQKIVTAPEVTGDIMSYLYENIHNMDKESDLSAVITIPVNFSERQKIIVKNAASKAGFKVDAIVTEPFAALFYLMEDYIESDERRNIFIFDFGGGTLDLCLATMKTDSKGKRIIETQSTVGILYGGNTINEDIIEYILKERKPDEIENAFENAGSRLLGMVNKNQILSDIDGLKGSLFSDETIDESETDSLISSIKYPESVFIDFGDISVGDIYKTFEKRGIKEEIYKLLDDLYDQSDDMIYTDTTDVFLIGGSASIPYFRSILEEYFERHGFGEEVGTLFETNDDIDMDDRLYSSVSMGAAKYLDLVGTENVCIKEKIPFTVYTKNNSGKIVTRINKNNCYKDYFSNYAPIQEEMKKKQVIPVYQTILDADDKEVFIGNIHLDDEICRNAQVYRIRIDKERNIEMQFGKDVSQQNETEFEWKWEKPLKVEIK